MIVGKQTVAPGGGACSGRKGHGVQRDIVCAPNGLEFGAEKVAVSGVIVQVTIIVRAIAYVNNSIAIEGDGARTNPFPVSAVVKHHARSIVRCGQELGNPLPERIVRK